MAKRAKKTRKQTERAILKELAKIDPNSQKKRSWTDVVNKTINRTIQTKTEEQARSAELLGMMVDSKARIRFDIK